MSATVQDLVRESLADRDKDELQKYAETIRVSWREQAASFNRSVVLLLASVITFELLSGAQLKQFALGPFVFANTLWVQVGIPTLVAYLFLDATVIAVRWDYYEDAHKAVIELINPQLAATGLDSLLGPRNLSVAGQGAISENLLKLHRYGSTTESAMGLLTVFSFGLVPLAFQIQAFILLISRHGVTNVFVWVSLGFSAILMGYAYRIFALYIFDV
jgi:hypothetical protein